MMNFLIVQIYQAAQFDPMQMQRPIFKKIPIFRVGGIITFTRPGAARHKAVSGRLSAESEGSTLHHSSSWQLVRECDL